MFNFLVGFLLGVLVVLMGHNVLMARGIIKTLEEIAKKLEGVVGRNSRRKRKRS